MRGEKKERRGERGRFVEREKERRKKIGRAALIGLGTRLRPDR